MRQALRRGVVLSAIAGGCVLAMTATALAATNGPTTSPEAIGLYANGLVGVANTADETTIGDTATFASVGVAGYLTADALSATVVSDNYDYASVADLTALGGTGITSGTITEYCVTTGAGTYSSYAVIENLEIGGPTGLTFSGTVTTPNDALGVEGVLTVTLNQEVTGPVGGSETWNAVDISVGGGSTEDIDIASATCGPYNSSEETPLASGKGLGIGLGAVGLLGGAYATVAVRRRRNAVSPV